MADHHHGLNPVPPPLNHHHSHSHAHHDVASPASGSAPVSAGPSRQGTGHFEPPPPPSTRIAGKGKSGSRERGTSSLGGQSVEPEDPNKPKDRHEPRGRKPNDQLPPSRAREVQRAFRLRRAEHLAALEERINLLEAENSQLRALLSLPEAERERIGSGPTGRGKSLKEGGVPMSERVRARKEARARERRLLGLPEPIDDSTHDEDELTEDAATPGTGKKRFREASTLSPKVAGTGTGTPGTAGLPGQQGVNGSGTGHASGGGINGAGSATTSNAANALAAFQMPSAPETTFTMPSFNNLQFGMPMADGGNPFGDFESAIFKNHPTPGHNAHHQQQSHSHQPSSGNSPNFAAMFGIYDEPNTSSSSNTTGVQNHNQNHSHNSNQNGGLAQPAPQYSRNVSNSGSAMGRSPISPPPSAGPSGTGASPATSTGATAGSGSGASAGQPDLLVRLRQCCHLSDSHVVNDPGLLIFATRLCQSFPCQFGGAHSEGGVAISDSEHLLLDDSWKLLRNQLDPGTELDGEHRINTGRMAAELVIRAAHSRGPGGWIVCRYTQGMSVKRALVAGLIQGLGGQFE